MYKIIITIINYWWDYQSVGINKPLQETAQDLRSL